MKNDGNKPTNDFITELLQTANSVIIRWNSNGKIVSINDFGLLFFGYTADEFIGKNIMEIVPGAEELRGWDPEVLVKDILVHPENHTIVSGENIRKDGQKVWVNWSNKAITDEHGAIKEILSIGNDITALKKANFSFTRLNRNCKIPDSITDGLLVLDINWICTEFSKTGAEMLGMRREDFIGKNIWDVFPHAEGTMFYQGYHRAMQTGKPVHFEEYYPEPLNQWLEVHCYPSEEGLTVYFRDVTDRKRSEEVLRDREQRYEKLFNNRTIGIAHCRTITDQSGKPVDYDILAINDAYTEITGIKKEDIEGRRARDVFPGIENYAFDYIGNYGKIALEGGELYFETFFESLEQWLEIYVYCPFHGEFVAIFTDISKRKKAEMALEESEKKLKVLNENLEDLVVKRTGQVRALSKALTLAEQRERKGFSRILHEDIQQKLYGVRMLLKQHLRDHHTETEAGDWDDIKEGIDVIERALRKTKALSIELNPPVLGTEGLDAALQWLVNHMYTAYGLDIDLRMHGSVQDIRHKSQLMLTQMVRELLNNVRQHAGVMQARIEVLCEGRRVQITVSDKGKGFDPIKMFSEKMEENRLGLISIRERLRMFDGDLEIESAPEKGTRVKIILPWQNC
ncbi:PAS/PAC sensor signal transduction histidine kinase [Chitinispirillum alkaliphilum]|nr:PAS/PAC sensor signal transduction histidine kinase [Chitinispirillum alkaliphilum]